jgi:hypothetical protein
MLTNRAIITRACSASALISRSHPAATTRMQTPVNRVRVQCYSSGRHSEVLSVSLRHISSGSQNASGNQKR